MKLYAIGSVLFAVLTIGNCYYYNDEGTDVDGGHSLYSRSVKSPPPSPSRIKSYNPPSASRARMQSAPTKSLYQAPQRFEQQTYEQQSAVPMIQHDVVGRPEPYNFNYDVKDDYGNNQFRREDSDDTGTVRGSYGYTDSNGLYRVVDYVADENGFRASIRTNEPGLVEPSPATGEVQNPADVMLTAEPTPAHIREQQSRYTSSSSASASAGGSSYSSGGGGGGGISSSGGGGQSYDRIQQQRMPIRAGTKY